ncbi:serine/threonine-protein kinase [Nonomuraea sp. NPDC005983]|uniref:serine/threonine-protein kinase n=1 Tax=Nonomuraea sp. NPDC005983 TaxID=3155595 RepID=UPI0033B80E8B
MAEETRPGRVVGGRYRLVTDLGSGGFGRVWKARDETLNVDVAVKERWLSPVASVAEQAERLTRAVREARNAARLRDHPNIVAVHDVVIDDDAPWIVMRLVHGCSLEDRLKAHGPLPVDQAADVARALLRALGTAHEAGVVHRDVKPGNVMLAANGEILLTDFGIAVHQTDTALTHTGMLIGSLAYMAPERARGQDATGLSDLFSLGVTLYQAVEGLSPFHRDTSSATLAAVLFEQVPPPRQAGRLAPLITRLMDKAPDERPSVSEALSLTDSPTTVRSALVSDEQRAPSPKTKILTTSGHIERKRRMHWQQVGASLLLALVFLLGVAGLDAGSWDGFVPAPHSSDARIAPVAITSLPALISALTVAGIVGPAVAAAGVVVAAAVGLAAFGAYFAAVYLAVAFGTDVFRTWMTLVQARWASLVTIIVLLAIAVGWQLESEKGSSKQTGLTP